MLSLTRLESVLATDHFELLATKIDDKILTELIPSLANSSEALFAICVTTQILISEHETEEFYAHYDAALLTFRSELAKSRGELNAGTLAAGLLLCTINMFQGMPWTIHLRSLHELLWSSNTLSLQQILSRPSNHFIEVMGVMDLPTFVIGRKNPSLGIWKQYRESQITLENIQENGIEPMSGIPRSLLDIFADIYDPHVDKRFWLWPGEQGEILQHHLWESFRFAGILISQRLQLRPHQNLAQDGPLLPDIVLPSHQILVSRLLSALHAVHLGLQSPMREGLLIANALQYPMMAFGLIAYATESNQQLIDVFEGMTGFYFNAAESRNVVALLDLLQQAKARGRNGFDLDAATERMDMEIAVF